MSHHLEQEFETLIQGFRAIAQIDSPVKRRFYLIKNSSFWGLPKSECRKLFELWMLENGDREGGES